MTSIERAIIIGIAFAVGAIAIIVVTSGISDIFEDDFSSHIADVLN